MNIRSRLGPHIIKTYALGGIVCAALACGAYFFGVKPASGRSQRQQDQQAQLRAQREKATELSSALTATHRQIEAANKSLAELPLRLEPASSINRRLAELTDLASTCKLTITEIRPGVVTDNVDFQTVPIQIIGTGTYPACAALLHEIKARFPDTAVRSLETANNNPSPSSTVGTYRLELLWHTAPIARAAKK